MHDTTHDALVAERGKSTSAFLIDNLAADGYEPLAAQTEEEARLKLRNHGPALLLLGALGEKGRSLAPLRRSARARRGASPCLAVIVLGQGDGGLELLRAFDAGCDHFIARPFS
jgi:DNA-binding response OmpR family regulator